MKPTLNQKIMANYMACFSLASYYRKKAASLPSGVFYLERKDYFNKVKDVLAEAKVLRINALYFTEIKS